MRQESPQGSEEASPAPDSRKLSLSKLWVLMVTAFVDMIGFALIVPLLPFYATDFGADGFVVGLLMAAFAFGQMLTSPLWGRLSDRIGRKPVLLLAQTISVVSFVVFAFADSVWLLFLCRVLQGVGGGSLGTVSAYVSDAVGPEERAKALGWITACTSAGVMVGPEIGSLAVRFDKMAPGLIAAAFCILNILFTWRWLQEARVVEPTRKIPKPKRLISEIGGVISQPLVTVNSLILIYAAGMMAFMSMTGMLALYLQREFGISQENIGHFYFGIGFVSVVMRGLLLGPLVRWFGEVRVLCLGAVVLGIGMIGMTFTQDVIQFVLVMLLIPAGTALLFPSTTSLVTRYADPDSVGQTVGVQQAFGGSSRLLAPIWAGAVFEHIGSRVPFWIGGILVLATAAFAFRLRPGAAPGGQREQAPSATVEDGGAVGEPPSAGHS